MADSLDYSIQYQHWHDDSVEHAEIMALHHEKMLAPLVTGDRNDAVDVGCGMGFTLMALGNLGFTNVVGIDRDKSQVESCLRKGLRVEQTHDVATWFSNQSASFDLVTMIDVLEHLPNEEQIPALQSIRTRLRPNGVVVIQVPNADCQLSNHWRYLDYTHTTTFTFMSLKFVLMNAGFRSVELVPEQPSTSRPPLRLWRAKSRHAFMRWLTAWWWRQTLIAALGEEGKTVPVQPNILVVAR